jgi:cyclophilin family peptidyl-prolyl cis-trans isomerase
MLDRQYTIVGEVVQAISIVDKIAKSLIHPISDRLLEAIHISVKN